MSRPLITKATGKMFTVLIKNRDGNWYAADQRSGKNGGRLPVIFNSRDRALLKCEDIACDGGWGLQSVIGSTPKQRRKNVKVGVISVTVEIIE